MIAQWVSMLMAKDAVDHTRGPRPRPSSGCQHAPSTRRTPAHTTGTMLDSDRRCRSGSVDRLLSARPHSRAQRIGCSCCHHNQQETNHDTPRSGRPLTASNRNNSNRQRPLSRTGKAKLKENETVGESGRTGGRRPVTSRPLRSSSSSRAGVAASSVFTLGPARSTSSINGLGLGTTSGSRRSSHELSRYSPLDQGREGANRAVHDADVFHDALHGKMNVAELPPIRDSSRKSGPGSGRSRRSSGHSSGGGTGLKLEKVDLIPLTNTDQKNMTKRSNRSPGSTGGSSGQAQSTGTSPRTSGCQGNANTESGARFKGKSWCPSDGSVPSLVTSRADGKLETLFEQKKVPPERPTSDTPSVPSTGLTAGKSTGLTPNSNGDFVKRTKSFSNLTKLWDTAKNGGQAKNGLPKSKPRIQVLHKVSSEQNISSLNRNSGAPQRPPLQQCSTAKRRVASIGQQANVGQTRMIGMQQSKSSPNFSVTHNITQSLLGKAGSGKAVEPHDYGSNGVEEGEREQRILDWLIGVENEEAERPPSPSIIEEEPVQTDTALHIVYDGE